MKIAIELDTVVTLPGDAPDPETLLWSEWRDQLGENGIVATIVNNSGPGGGWPIVRYVGERSAIEQMLITNFNANSPAGDSLEFMLSDAETIA